MTATNYPETEWGTPDGKNYHYRFHANDEEAWRCLKLARWVGRGFELYPREMKHLRVKLDHVTVRTFDRKNHIKGMKNYAVSPDWEVIPHSLGRMEMKNANRGGSKIRAEEYTGEYWGTVEVTFTVDYTPTEIKAAYEDGENEDAVRETIGEARHWAVEDKIEELQEAEWRFQERCGHHHVVRDDSLIGIVGYCEDCGRDWEDDDELDAEVTA